MPELCLLSPSGRLSTNTPHSFTFQQPALAHNETTAQSALTSTSSAEKTDGEMHKDKQPLPSAPQQQEVSEREALAVASCDLQILLPTSLQPPAEAATEDETMSAEEQRKVPNTSSPQSLPEEAMLTPDDNAIPDLARDELSTKDNTSSTVDSLNAPSPPPNTSRSSDSRAPGEASYVVVDQAANTECREAGQSSQRTDQGAADAQLIENQLQTPPAASTVDHKEPDRVSEPGISQPSNELERLAFGRLQKTLMPAPSDKLEAPVGHTLAGSALGRCVCMEYAMHISDKSLCLRIPLRSLAST